MLFTNHRIFNFLDIIKYHFHYLIIIIGFSDTTDPTKSVTSGSAGDYGWSGAANTCFVIDPKQEMITMYFMQLFPFDVSYEKFRAFTTAAYQ
jgi:CubicO group peptidase (beta-lactamase class C family)